MEMAQVHLAGECGDPGGGARTQRVEYERVLTCAVQVTDSDTGQLIAMSRSASKLDGTKFTVEILEEGLPILDAMVTSFALLEARAKAAHAVALAREASI